MKPYEGKHETLEGENMKPHEGKHETPNAASNEKVNREYFKLLRGKT